jgi:hypothetical protein
VVETRNAYKILIGRGRNGIEDLGFDVKIIVKYAFFFLFILGRCMDMDFILTLT